VDIASTVSILENAIEAGRKMLELGGKWLTRCERAAKAHPNSHLVAFILRGRH
jgi:hypothetical protein